jgi:hypothetical protein
MTNLNSGLNKELIRKFVDATNRKNWDILNEIIADDVIRYSSTFNKPEISSREELIDFHKKEL